MKYINVIIHLGEIKGSYNILNNINFKQIDTFESVGIFYIYNKKFIYE